MAEDKLKTTAMRRALELACPRPPEGAPQADKKNYAERLSRSITQAIANGLRSDFPEVLPDQEGSRHESRARTAKGFKRLDVNYSVPELGLALGVSVKTINYRDASSENYKKNYSRVDAELRAEAKDYHDRQPFAVMIAVVLIPADACGDGSVRSPSSFGAAVKYFRSRAGRRGPRDEAELFERVYIGFYEHSGDRCGDCEFFDVSNAPPRNGPPKANRLSFEEFLAAIAFEYDARNDPPFAWAAP